MSIPLVGSECVLRISDDDIAPNFLLVEGLRVSGWKVITEKVEVTNGSDEGWRRLLPGAGLRALEVRLSGLYLGSAGGLRLREAAFNGLAFEAELTLDRGEAVRGHFVVSELGFESVINEEATYEALLRSAGPISIS